MASTSEKPQDGQNPDESNSTADRVPILSPEEKEELSKHVYSFENLALEGGGSKGGAYVGAMRVLEEVGIWKNIRRFSGASVGGLAAIWTSLGYDSYELEKLFASNLQHKVFDAFMGRASLVFNMVVDYGWHPGKRLLDWMGEIIEAKLSNPDATFADTGRELCIVAANVNDLGCFYCHVKTTPTMPLRIAAKMSMAIPGVFAPVKYKLHGTANFFCDGGLLCNYPIHVFDGWYLSMKPEDNFLRRIPDLNDPVALWDVGSKFGCEPDKKTIGMLLFSEGEQDLFKNQYRERIRDFAPEPNPFPNTKLARKRKNTKHQQDEMANKHKELVDAMTSFITLLRKHDVDDSGTISRDELKQALEKGESMFPQEQKKILFGKISFDEIFNSIDKDGDGEITFNELTSFAEQKGMEVRKMWRGFESRKVTSVGSYFDAVVETLLLNMKRVYIKAEDRHRTIGIDTRYLDTLDFDMEPDDKEFLMKQGKIACVAFLRSHVAKQNDAAK